LWIWPLRPHQQYFIFLANYEWANNVEFLSLASLSSQVQCNTLAFWSICKLQGKQKVVNAVSGVVFAMSHFHHNLWMCLISWSVALLFVGKGCQGQILYLIGTIYKLQTTWLVVNTLPMTPLTTLHSFHNLRMCPISYSVILH
jgi:hypothetical protein